MDKNSRKFLKVLALLLCEANNIGGMKSSASGNGNLQLIISYYQKQFNNYKIIFIISDECFVTDNLPSILNLYKIL